MIRKIKSIRPNKSVLVLVVSVALGLVAALVARSYMSNRIEEIESGLKGKMIEVVVAKADLERGALLTPDTVAIRQVPAEFSHEQAITPTNYEAAAGETLAFSVKAGQLILWPMLLEKKAPAFSHRVEVGRRAMTVPVDEISSISGMLEPGDMIDLMVTVDRAGRKITLPLLQNVQVLATGQQSIDDPKSGERRDYSTVTLDTTPKQAQQVIAAREEGRITALLRNPQDKEVLADGAMNLDSLLGSQAVAPAQAASSSGDEKDAVPVLYGGANPNYTPEQLNLRSSGKLLEILNSISMRDDQEAKTNAAGSSVKEAK